MKKIIIFIATQIIAQSAGIIGAVYTTPAIAGWYMTIIKPSFNPPNYIFGPVWIVLYILLGVVLYRLVTRGQKRKEYIRIRYFFYLHLVLNGLWSFLFFGAHEIGYALVDIIVLWAMIVALMLWLKDKDKVSAYLLVPYLLWVTFATILNHSLYLLN